MLAPASFLDNAAFRILNTVGPASLVQSEVRLSRPLASIAESKASCADFALILFLHWSHLILGHGASLGTSPTKIDGSFLVALIFSIFNAMAPSALLMQLLFRGSILFHSSHGYLFFFPFIASSSPSFSSSGLAGSSSCSSSCNSSPVPSQRGQTSSRSLPHPSHAGHTDS